MTYADPIRLTLKGDSRAAAVYVNRARQMAFGMMRRITESGATSARRRFELADDTVIEITIVDLAVEIEITVGPPEGGDVRAFEDFVVFARTTEQPDGYVLDYPEQILRPPTRGTPAWRTYFYNNLSALYLDRELPKGTYHLNPDGTELFPDGVRHAGTIDWRGPKGERISWYGPSSRYWFDAYVQPSAQYKRFVFHLGQILLDLQAYADAQVPSITFTESKVVSAFVREHTDDGLWLYVMLADMPDITTDFTPVGPNIIYFSEPYPLYTTTYSLWRFRLDEDLTTREANKWSVIDGTHEEVWVASAYRGCNPWFFDQLGERGAFFVQDDSVPVFVTSGVEGDSMAAPPPATTTTIIRVTVSEAGTVAFTTESTSLPAGPGSALLAIDYDDANGEVQVELVREPVGAASDAISLRVGTWTMPLWYIESVAHPGYSQTVTRRRLVWVDAREKAAVVDVQQTDGSAPAVPSPRPFGFRYYAEFSCAGTLQARSALADSFATTTAGAALDRFVKMLTPVAAFPTAPLAWLYMQYGRVSVGSNLVALHGLLATGATQRHRPADLFGAFRAVGSGGGAQVPVAVASYGSTGFNNNTPDLHDHRSPVGAAAQGTNMVVSLGRPQQPTTLDSDTSVNYITGSTLDVVTGVTGTEARYHPIWLLGFPPGSDKPPL